MAYNLIVADSSPAIRRLCQSIFPEETFRLHLAGSLEELNQLLETTNPEALILGSTLLEASDSLLPLQARLSAGNRVPVFLLAGTFEPLPRDCREWLKPEKVFLKPFYSESLAEAVREAVEKRRVPDTLPEELPDSPLKETSAAGSQVNPGLLRELRHIIQQEVLEAERELEKRLRASLQATDRGEPKTREPGGGQQSGR
ncbi:MAG: response regulator [Candidatus Saccharicenans sp.]|nr:response regulator [Candidatus Saccharicenans sp.]